MKIQNRNRKQLKSRLESAESYSEWHAAAEALDEMDGLLAWREDDSTQLLHESLIRDHISRMKRLREQCEMRKLIRVLQESLYRHLGELSNPELYAFARTGTKYLAGEFLREVETSMQFICDNPIPDVPESRKLELFQEAEHVYGQPALMLSGGAAFGVYHVGVTRALWNEDLLPRVIAGSSMGAIVAGMICSRNDSDLEEFFQHPQRAHREAFRWRNPGQAFRDGYMMDQDQLHEHIQANIGSVSFQEAFERSGRELNISISPTRTQQKPRLLNRMASPGVLVDYAVLASCAVPGLYPPVMLRARDPEPGSHDDTSYMPSERWIDGSIHGDLPLMRMARLHNVNKTIVSQANPHVVPFISHHHHRGTAVSLKRAVQSVAHGQLATTLNLTRNWSSPVFRPLMEQAYAMTTQTYLGDINIHFPFRPTLYRKVLSNPSAEDLEMYIRMGERATWPRIAMIRDQTRISHAFKECIEKLKKRAEKEQTQEK
ncbi:patatin-like phospholipase family protein [Marinobacter sp.]|uniref:patatin-like phospholipase family protein n=1 Tax=Marinobacter sp. TaxID=50741 RepID=UPI00384DB765